jgi:hypothetical protein
VSGNNLCCLTFCFGVFLSAQKLGVILDSLVLSSYESLLMQQACFLTGGLYFRHGDWLDLLNVLTTYFLVDPSLRKDITLPLQVFISGLLFYLLFV